MSPDPIVALRPDLQRLTGYHSAQVDVEVKLNVNESPYPPPPEFREELAQELARLDYHRYPDRDAERLRAAVAEHHGVSPDEVFCANGSNEVLQCLLLAFGGPGRTVACFEPTYALHRHISSITGTAVASGRRAEDFTLPDDELDRVVTEHDPVIVFLCSPNNPTGRAEPRRLVEHALEVASGLVVVDEAYAQFAHWSALDIRPDAAARGGGTTGGSGAARRLAVVRTFSKTWSMAAVRLGYLVADPEVVAACQQVVLPYHLSTTTQLAGLLALRYGADMERRVAQVAEERGRVAAALADLPVETWPSEANFILFRPLEHPATTVWSGLVDRSILVRDCSSWESLEGCLRVTIGTKEENDRFLEAVTELLR